MNNKTSLLDAVLELQRTIQNFQMPDAVPAGPHLLAAYQDLETAHEELQEQLEDTQRDYEVCKHALMQHGLKYHELEQEFHLKMQQSDEVWERAQKNNEYAAQAYQKLEEMSTAHEQLELQLQEAQQEIDQLEAESEAAALALVSEVKNLESELADVRGKLDEVLYAQESETLQLREDLHSATQQANHFQEKFALLKQTNLHLSQENAKLRQTIDEINLDGGWRAAAEQERELRATAEARLQKLERLFKAALE